MAVVGHLHRINFGGRLATTETWSVGLHFLNPDPGVLVLSGLMASGISQWFLRASSAVSPLATLDWIKGNELNPASVPSTKPGAPASPPFTRYLSGAETNEYFYVLPAGVGQGGTTLPPQNASVVSTVTALGRGRASKGRFYVPSGWNVAADGRISQAGAAGMATSAAQLVTDINGSSIGSCVVFSSIGQITAEITGVRVGRVMDTQRRRRTNLVEDYQAVPVA